jgi:hypothetical protein
MASVLRPSNGEAYGSPQLHGGARPSWSAAERSP